MEHSFSILESLRFGWRTLREHSTLLFQVILTLFALEVAYAIVSRTLTGTLLGALADVALIALSFFLSAGFTRIALKLARGEGARYGELLPPASLVVTYVLASLLAGVITALPAIVFLIIAIAASVLPPLAEVVVAVVFGIACIIACAYLALRYTFVRFAVVDGRGITESLRESAARTAGQKWHLLLFLIVLLVLNVIGAALILVGLLVSMPVTMLALAHAYLALRR